MSTKLEDLVVRLKADSSELERELRKSGVAVNRFSKQAETGFASLTSAAKKFAGTLAVAFAANELRKFANAALELGGSLNDTAQRLGTTAESLQVYRLQAQEAGVDSGAVDSSLQSLSKTLGQVQAGIGRATKQLTALDPALLKSLQTAGNTDQAYRLVADAIKKAADAGDQQRAAAIASATGMSALLGPLKEGARGFDAVNTSARATGQILSNEAAATLDAFGEKLDSVKRSALTGFAEGLAGASAGARDLTSILSDPATLKGISDTARELGRITSELGRIAGFVGPVMNVIDILRTPPEKLRGRLFGPDFSGVAGGASSTEPFGVRPAASSAPSRTFSMPGGSRRANAAPKLDYSITNFDYFAAEKQAMKSMVDGYDKSMEEMKKSSAVFAEEGIEHFRKMQDAAEAFGSFMGNTVGTFVREGKLDFKGLAMSFAESLIEMEVAAAASSLFKSAAAGSKGSGSSSTIGSILGFLMSAIGIGGAAEGGYFTKPTLAMIGEGKENEWALPDSKLKGLLAASGGRTVVNVHNYGNEQVTTKTRQSGGQEVIDVMVGRSIRRQLAAGGLKDEFGRRHAPGIS